jgi:hypothetical protein
MVSDAMRKLLASTVAFLALCGAAAAQGVGAPNPILCNQVIQGTTTQQFATAIASKNIVVCGWDVNANVALGAFSLASGTGATCGSTTANIVVWTGLPVGVFIDHNTYAFTPIASTQNLCVTAATTVSYTIYWGQF